MAAAGGPVQQAKQTNPEAKPEAGQDLGDSVRTGLALGQMSAPGAPPPDPRTVLALQRAIGNRAVQRWLADRGLPRSAQEPVQRTTNTAAGMDGGTLDDTTTSEIRRAQAGGRPLESGIRRRMEQGFGADFSNVRVHTDGNADRLSRSLNAKAFTTGSSIFFRRNTFNPGSNGGQKLLAHELTHVVQQGGAKTGPIQTKLTVGPAQDRYEEEADRVAHQVMRSMQSSAAKPNVQRAPKVQRIQRLLLPEADRAFKFAASVNPDYAQGRQMVDHYIDTGTTTDSEGKTVKTFTDTGVDNVTANEQKKLMDLGSGQSIFGRLFGKGQKQSMEQEDRLKDYIRADLLTEFAQRTNTLRNDDRYKSPKAKAKRRKFYLDKALFARDKVKPLIKQGVASEEAKTWMREHGFAEAIGVTKKQEVNELLKGPRIDVRSTFIGGPILGVNVRAHLYIVYTGRDGRQFFFRGGPDHHDYTVVDYGEYSSENTTDFDPSAPSVTVLQGDAAEAKLDALVEASSVINAQKVPYQGQVPTKLFGKSKNVVAQGLDAVFGTHGENCNSAAWTILTRAGIPAKKPVGKHPGWGTLLGSDTDPTQFNAIAPKETDPTVGDRYVLSKQNEILDKNNTIQVYRDRGLFQPLTKVGLGMVVELLSEGRDYRKIRLASGAVGFLKKNDKERWRNAKEDVRRWLRQTDFEDYYVKYFGLKREDLAGFDFGSLDVDEKVDVLWALFEHADETQRKFGDDFIETMLRDLRMDLNYLAGILRELSNDKATVFQSRVDALSDDELEAVMNDPALKEFDAMARDAGLDIADAKEMVKDRMAAIRQMRLVEAEIGTYAPHPMQLNMICNEFPDFDTVYEIANQTGVDANFALNILDMRRPTANRGMFLNKLIDGLDEYELQALAEQQRLFKRKLDSLADKLGVPPEFVAHRIRDYMPKAVAKLQQDPEYADKVGDRLPVYRYATLTPPDVDTTPELEGFISWGDIGRQTDVSDEYMDQGWMSFAVDGTYYWVRTSQYVAFAEEKILEYADKLDEYDLEAMSQKQPMYANRLARFAQRLGMGTNLLAVVFGNLLPELMEQRKDDPDRQAELRDRLPVYRYSGAEPPAQDELPELVAFISWSDVSSLTDPNHDHYNQGWFSFALDGTRYWAKLAQFFRFVDEQGIEAAEKYDEYDLEMMMEGQPLMARMLNRYAQRLGMTPGLAAAFLQLMLPRIREQREDDPERQAQLEDRLPVYTTEDDDVPEDGTTPELYGFLSASDYEEMDEFETQYEDEGWDGFYHEAMDMYFWARAEHFRRYVKQFRQEAPQKVGTSGGDAPSYDPNAPFRLYDDYSDEVLQTITFGFAKGTVTKSDYGRNNPGWVDVVHMMTNYRVKQEDWDLLNGVTKPKTESLAPVEYAVGTYPVTLDQDWTFMGAMTMDGPFNQPFTMKVGGKFNVIKVTPSSLEKGLGMAWNGGMMPTFAKLEVLFGPRTNEPPKTVEEMEVAEEIVEKLENLDELDEILEQLQPSGVKQPKVLARTDLNETDRSVILKLAEYENFGKKFDYFLLEAIGVGKDVFLTGMSEEGLNALAAHLGVSVGTLMQEIDKMDPF